MKDNIVIKVSGKNIENYIRKLVRNKVKIYNLKKIDYKTIIVELDYNEYLTINKTIYEIEIIKYKGKTRLINIFKKYKYLFISLIIGYILLKVLLNMIFEIDIVHTDPLIRKIVKNELKSNGVVKYSKQLSFDKLESIEKLITNNNRNTIEWIEIIKTGCKYTVRIEERIKNSLINNNKIYNVVSSKDAVIKKIVAYNGEIVKTNNQYVKKGEVIISSNITFNGNIKNVVSAKGLVYGETWYKINVSYPLTYTEELVTNKTNKALVFSLFNSNIELNKKFKNKRVKNNYLYKNNILPIYISLQNQREVIKSTKKLDYNDAYKEALKLAHNKISKKLDKEEYIIYEKCLKISKKDSTINLEVFYSIYEDITKYVEVGE